jgi:CBS domain-containing protein
VPTPIRDVMTTRVVTVRSGEPVSAAAERMTRFGFSALPVVTSSGRLVGIVSLLDVLCLRQEAADRGAPADDRVAVDTIMTAGVFTMAPTANVAVVADRLHRRGDLRVLPITDGGRLVGVVTRGDLVRRLLPGAPTRRRRWFGRRPSADHEVDALGLLAATRRSRPPAVHDAPVRSVMTADVVTAGPDTAVDEAAVLMLRERHSGLPVVDDTGRLLGVVSEADLLAGGNARTVGRVMTAPALSVAADATVAQATALLVARGLRTVPVVDGDRLVGVLGRSDLV